MRIPRRRHPRLIYSYFLEENGEADRAAFIRAQLQLARTPIWEPFAVMCRFRRTIGANEVFRGSLPELPPSGDIEWRRKAFRRGFGWRMHAWKQIQMYAATSFQLLFESLHLTGIPKGRPPRA